MLLKIKNKYVKWNYFLRLQGKIRFICYFAQNYKHQALNLKLSNNVRIT